MSDGPFSPKEALLIWAHYDRNKPNQERDPETGAYRSDDLNAPREIAYIVHQHDPQKIRELHKEQLLQALKAGSAFATGELVPAKHNAERKTIPANRWPFMDLDIEKGPPRLVCAMATMSDTSWISGKPNRPNLLHWFS